MILAAAVLQPYAGVASQESEALQRCRYLHDRIEHYTRLRRGGGNGVQMERWRTARQTFEREYRQRRCYRFGSRLTIRP